jgi:hypothetical protein
MSPARRPVPVGVIVVAIAAVAAVSGGVALFKGTSGEDIIAGSDSSSDTQPVTTVVTTPEPSVPESFVWPTVVAGDFLLEPSGPVGGARTSDLTSPCNVCLLTGLDDGRVLKVGPGGMAEIWDSATGAWSAIGPANADSSCFLMCQLGGRATAVLLDDGRVLIAGMEQPQPTQSSVVIFDPQTESFSLLSNPPLGDDVVPPGAVAIKLSDGRVLIASSPRGGFIFDPVDDAVTSVGQSRPGAPPDAGIGLADGRALLVRGSNLLVFDPANPDRFRSVATTYDVASHPDASLSLTALADGRVLLTGGALLTENGEPQLLADAAVFDPETETVTPLRPMLEPRAGHSTVTLPDGRGVIIGGGAGDRVEIYDPSSGSFRAAPVLSRPRDDASAVTLEDGNLLVVGGVDQRHGLYTVDLSTPLTAEVYHPNGLVSATYKGSLSGVTLGFEVDSLPLFHPGDGWASAHIVIPPGGLEGATRAQLRSGGEFGITGVDFFSAKAPPPEGWEQPRFLPDECEQGCELDALLVGLVDLREWLSVHLHIQYAGEIPAAAAGITLTVEVVEDEGGR